MVIKKMPLNGFWWNVLASVSVVLTTTLTIWLLNRVVENTRRLDRIEVEQVEQDRRIMELEQSWKLPRP